MKADKADKIIKKAELKAKKAAQQVEVANRKAEATRQKRAAQAQKKAAKAANAATKKAAAKTKKAEAVAKKAQLAAQKAEAKKAKALEKAAAKAAEAPGGGDEGGEGAAAAPKKKSKKKLLMIAAPVLAVAVGAGVYFFFLRGGGEEEEGPPEPIAIPVEYVFPVSDEIEEHIIALPVWGEEVLVYREELVPEPPEEPEDGESDDAAALSDKDEAEGEEGDEGGDKEGEPAGYYPPDEDAFIKILYRYEGLQSPADLISAYTALMTTQDAGFSTVDETLLRIDPPEEFGARGTVLLARNGTEGEVQSMLLSWEGTDCSVTLDMPEGRVHDPKPETSGGIAGQPRRGLSDLEAMHPSQLGLPGDSMEAYELMPQEGSVRIAGSVCARVNIYDRGSGQIAGSYFLSSDGKLYKLEEDVNAVVELPWE